MDVYTRPDSHVMRRVWDKVFEVLVAICDSTKDGHFTSDPTDLEEVIIP